MAGNELVIRALLQKGAKPNIVDGRKKTSFHHAARKGDLQALKVIKLQKLLESITSKNNVETRVSFIYDSISLKNIAKKITDVYLFKKVYKLLHVMQKLNVIIFSYSE